jgi:hypothetical protein
MLELCRDEIASCLRNKKRAGAQRMRAFIGTASLFASTRLSLQPAGLKGLMFQAKHIYCAMTAR